MDIDSIVPLSNLIGICRILFGIIFFCKIFVSYKASALVWAHEVPFSKNRSQYYLKGLLIILLINIFFLTIGLLTPLAALITWGLYVFIYKYASLYGLEDVSFQHMAFYFMLTVPNSSFALDNVLHIELWDRLGGRQSSLPEIFLAIALGLVFFTAGFEKLFSPMWRKGLGAYYFYLMPQFRRMNTDFITGSYFLSVSLNWLALFMELFILPVFLVNAFPCGLFLWFLGIGFTTSLASIFILTWIGECLTIGMILVLWLLLKSGKLGLVSLLLVELNYDLSWLEKTISCLIILSFFASIFTVLVRRDSVIVNNLKWFKNFYVYCRYVSRFTWGLLPLKVFTEVHIEGPVVYRVFLELADGTSKETFKIFHPDCGPGIERPFRPAFFEVTSYKVAEACMELDKFGSIVSEDRKMFMLNLVRYILSRSSANERNQVLNVKFLTKQICMPGNFVGSKALYPSEPWVEAFLIGVNLLESGELDLKILNTPILKHPTGRNIERHSFSFNPMDA